MNELQMQQGNENYGAEAMNIIAERKARVGVIGLANPINLNLEAETLLPTVARLLAMKVKIQKNLDLDSSLVEKYLRTLIVYRVMQLENRCPMASRDVTVPDFFYPVLAQIGKYEDPMRSLRLLLTTTMQPELSEEEMEDTGFMFRQAGVKCTRGLPRMLMIGSDAMYRVQSAGGTLRVAGDDVGDLVLLIRTVIRLEFAETIFGAARTQYLSIEDARASWESIVGMSVQ